MPNEHEGTLFEFESVDQLIEAARAARAFGAAELEAYTPYAVPEIEATLRIRRTRIPRGVLVAAFVGCAVAFAIIWATNAYDYPLDVGGRPLNSLPTDIPIMFETTVLFGSLAAFGLVLFRSGLPRLHHPVFEVEGIETASIDRFWLRIGHDRPLDPVVRRRMEDLGALSERRVGGGGGG